MGDEARRVLIAGLLGLGTIAAAGIVFCARDLVFYSESKQSVADAWRMLWMLPFILGGLATRAWRWRKHGTELQKAGKPTASPYWAYLIKYPLWLAGGSMLLFAALHSFLELDNWLFYPTSAVVSIAIALAPGRAPWAFSGVAGEGR